MEWDKNNGRREMRNERWTIVNDKWEMWYTNYDIKPCLQQGPRHQIWSTLGPLDHKRFSNPSETTIKHSFPRWYRIWYSLLWLHWGVQSEGLQSGDIQSGGLQSRATATDFGSRQTLIAINSIRCQGTKRLLLHQEPSQPVRGGSPPRHH